MNLWREVSDLGGRVTYYLDAPARPDKWAKNVGFVERLEPTRYNACDMSHARWEWREFDNLREAKLWLEVCARMNDGLA